MGIANMIRLLSNDFLDFRIVEKILVIMPKKYEASITLLENTKDLSKTTLAQEQQRLMREDRVVEGALPGQNSQQTTKTKARVRRKITHLVSIVKNGSPTVQMLEATKCEVQ